MDRRAELVRRNRNIALAVIGGLAIGGGFSMVVESVDVKLNPRFNKPTEVVVAPTAIPSSIPTPKSETLTEPTPFIGRREPLPIAGVLLAGITLAGIGVATRRFIRA